MSVRRLFWIVLVVSLLSSCDAASVGKTQPLKVSLPYPNEDSSLHMGQALKAIIDVRDAAGAPDTDAQVLLTISDPAGNKAGEVRAVAGAGDVFRSEPWTIPHRSQAGAWSITTRATDRQAEGETTTTFVVKDSVSEYLLKKYGFWANNPSLGGMETGLYGELGDAQNGRIFWGGSRQQMHILPESRIEVYWRTGSFPLQSSQQVRDFLLNEVGNLGFIDLRELGEFTPVRFEQWDAWVDKARGRLSEYDIQYMVFYAPEVNKTYVLGTMVVQPPTNIDPHATLRDGFEVHPEVAASGKGDLPWTKLLPTPVLISPDLGARYIGTDKPIVLRWKPLKELAEDEYYKVSIDFDFSETNTLINYATRKTEFTLPTSLFATPNCGVFNWQITLMRRTGVGKDGQPVGEALSYNSLHWYVEWLYARGDAMPFTPHCQNPQT